MTEWPCSFPEDANGTAFSYIFFPYPWAGCNMEDEDILQDFLESFFTMGSEKAGI